MLDLLLAAEDTHEIHAGTGGFWGDTAGIMLVLPFLAFLLIIAFGKKMKNDGAEFAIGALAINALWATVLRSGGYQDPHNHPGRVLSGVYYVQLPGELDDTRGRDQGAIEFGTPPERLGMTAEVERRLIRPGEGQLLLFPSHFWHRTIPAFGDRDRISIAFDVLADG